MSAVIKVRELSVTVTATGNQVVQGISFDVAAGERVGIIGESGSGKSVTTLALIGLLPAGLQATGSIQIGDQQVIGAAERDLLGLRGQKVATIFQDPSAALDPLCRVGELIAEPLRRHRRLRGSQLRAAVLQALQEVALPSDERMLRAFPHEISGGQRQRVAIAMALACRPAILIADEATTALDVTVQADILQLLDRLCSEHQMGLIFVSHDLAVVAEVANHGIVMQSGQIVEAGPIEQLIGSPQQAYTKSLVASARALETALQTGGLVSEQP